MECLAGFPLHAHVIDLRIGGDRDLRHRIDEAGVVLQRDEVLDDRHRASGLGHDEAARVARRVLLRRDVQEVHRDGRIHPARHDDQCAVLEKGGVERSEHVVAKIHVASEVQVDHVAVRLPGRRQVYGHYAAVRDAGQLWCMHAVDEDQSGRRFVEMKTPNGRRGGTDRRVHRLERHPGERRDVGETPLLVASRRHGEHSDAIDRLGAQLVEPGERTRRQLRLRGKERLEVSRGRHRAVLTSATFAARCSAPTQS